MSSVKIKDIYYDGEVDSCEKVKNIEVVPRKMIELIIEKCNEIVVEFGQDPTNYANGRCNSARQLNDYAEWLLELFEEDEKWVNIPKGLSDEELQELELEERV